MNDEKLFYTTKELAEILRVSEATICWWCQTQKIRAFKFGREWRIPKIEIEKLLYGDEYVREKYFDRD